MASSPLLKPSNISNIGHICRAIGRNPGRPLFAPFRALSKSTQGEAKEQTTFPSQPQNSKQSHPPQGKKKSLAELDEELRMKMEGIVGDGGEAGVEYEDGVPVAMKRSVKNNMFRYI